MSEPVVKGVKIAESDPRTETSTNGVGTSSIFEENEGRLRQAIADADATVRTSWDSWQRYVDETVDLKLTALLSEAAEKHRTLFDRFVSNGTPPGHSASILEYRRAVEEDIVRVLLEAFDAKNTGRALQMRFSQVLDEISTSSDLFPEQTALSNPRDLFDPGEDDGMFIAIRKMGRRRWLATKDFGYAVRNRARTIVGKQAVDPEPPARLVPTRALARYHLEHELSALLAPEYESTQVRVARRIADLEKALTMWANDLLTRERDAEIRFEGTNSPAWESVTVAKKDVAEEGAPFTHSSAERGSAESESDSAGEEAAPAPEEKSGPDLFDEIRQIGEALQEHLDKIAAAPSEAERPEPPSFEDANKRFVQDLQKAGTFLLTMSDRSVAPSTEASFVEGPWALWHAQVVDRLRYLDLLLLIRERILKIESSIIDRTARATVVSVLRTFNDMKAQFAESLQRAKKVADSDSTKVSPKAYAKEIDALRDQLGDVLASVLKDLPGLVSSDQALSNPGRDEWVGLGKFVDGLPEQLVMHELYDEDEEIGHKIRTAEVNFRGLVNDVLLIQLPDRLRKPADGLRAAVRTVWTETEQVHHIVQYNLDAAIDELHKNDEDTRDEPESGSAHSGEAPDPPTPAERTARARQLTVDGIVRASGTLDQLAISLREPWEAFANAVDHELREDWVAIHRRLKAADSADEQWAGYRARATRQVERVIGRGRKLGSRIGDRAVKLFAAAQRRVMSLIRIGQSAVGVVDSGETERYDTIDAISSVQELRNSLPLIYKRLFSFDPLDELSLLEGRSRDLVWIKQHFERWHKSMQLGVVLVRAPLGSGRTTFLNAVRKSIFKDHAVKLINLPERLYHPDEFAAIVADALEIDQPGITLDELEEHLINTRRADPPHVCMIDNAEHLLMRASQSVNVIERVILFMSHTDTSIYWMGTIGEYAWQFLSKTASIAVSFVDSYALTPLDRATMESLIINRHRRSGMPLHFPEPQDPSALMRQRLRRAKTAEQRQAVLREDFFDRLWKASGETIMLALYYWIRSADFSDEDGPLEIRPMKPLNFDFLNRFELTHAFTLKAFFLHKTLSLSDHSRIFHMSSQASTAILESLLNLHIIEPVPRSERVPGDYHVQRDAIYRLKPLLINPVTTFLQGKNIVY